MIAGVDFSTRAIDIVLLHDDKPEATWHRHRLDYAPGDAFDAARRVAAACPPRSWWTDNTIMAGIERPFSQNRGTVAALLRIEGALLATMPLELDVLELTAHQWKRELTGKANADKAAVKRRVTALWPQAADWPQDAFDAYGIAFALRALCERQTAA